MSVLHVALAEILTAVFTAAADVASLSIPATALLFMFQEIAVLSQLQLETLPMPVRSMGRALTWANGRTGIWHAIFGSSLADVSVVITSRRENILMRS